MARKNAGAFFAFPASPEDLRSTIEAAIVRANRAAYSATVGWPDLGIFGQSIPDEVRASINNAGAFVFDITQPNLNVYYEAGFAIGLGLPIAPVVNSSFIGAVENVQRDGLFDNVGYKKYDNNEHLAGILLNLPSENLLSLYGRDLDSQQPLFFLDTLRKTDFRNSIVSAIKGSKVHFRSFDPVEIPRFSVVPIIAQITASAGLVVPLLPAHVEDSWRHNLRAAFIAGMGHGLDRDTLIIQARRFDEIAPADIREIITPVTDEKSIAVAVESFAKTALLASQSIKRRQADTTKSALQRLTLGSSAAENEFRTLSSYFVETAEFVRTLRGEVSVVAGRKGSGKTAIFFQARDSFREAKSFIVTDLKPESHQLTYFREELLKIIDVGAFDHTIAGFWYFLILSEILLTISDDLERRARFNSTELEKLNEVQRLLTLYGVVESGDFTARINRLARHILQEVQALHKSGKALSPETLTNIVFRGGVHELRRSIEKYARPGEQMIVLFDNIDKGWPSAGVQSIDIRLVRLLLEALEKIKRDFSAAHREFMSVVFLRNDIYEMLVDTTPDRGKAGQVRIDWTDRAKLKQVIFLRLRASLKDQKSSFETIWARFFRKIVLGRDTFEYFVDHCLMRPRFLINIIENAISNAINRGHSIVDDGDCIDAVRQHSLYLVDDFGYEIRDVSGLSAEILYSLVGVEKQMSKSDFVRRFGDSGLTSEEAEKAFHLMLWYGVVGIISKSGEERFIYDYEYNMKRLGAEARNLGDNAIYVTNPALHVALAG
ncbi:P-loop ATPase, Sll1717 family [Mesorhizobium sp. CN2-181]|uniref:P-loop ATPase, Sll1717 family n=1 Tax=Mesorhizobium yinganensis TaxID=3157707 RepID=UPI0032B7B4D0